MKHKNLSILFLLLASILFIKCSEVKDDISQPPLLEGVHPDGFAKMSSPNFHSNTIKANNWDLESCQKCHASDYSGGLTGVSCMDCHTQSAGPEACNTCHGVFADPDRIAPPNDMNGNYETTAKGVGAHTAHIYENTMSLGVSCFECHPGNVGSGDFVKAHIDGLPAEMQFGTIASSGLSTPIYNSDLTCANTYCHGNFEFTNDNPDLKWAYTEDVISGENFSPKWTQVDGSQAACGTCHLLPPVGHFNSGNDPEAKTCGLTNCHTNAYNEDGSLNTFTHIDGKKTLY